MVQILWLKLEFQAHYKADHVPWPNDLENYGTGNNK